MAQFDASINLNVNSSKAERQVKRLEAAVDKVNRAATKLDFNNKNLDKAAAAAERLYRTLEKIESAALSKLPTSVQTLIAYLKAANVATAKLTANAVGAAVGFKQISGVSFAPIIRQEKQVRDLLFEIIEAQVKFQNAARNFRPRLSGRNPFQYILDGLDLVQVKVIETKQLMGAMGITTQRSGPGDRFYTAGGGGGGRGGGGGGNSLGGSGGGRALPPADLGFTRGNQNTLRGLRFLRAELQNLLDTTVIGTKLFRQLENRIEEVNNEIRDAQLLGQRGGSGVEARRRGRAGRFADRVRENAGFGPRGAGRGAGGFGGAGGLGAAIGFPLLFGGGPGSILGGVAGQLLGGFGGAILGSGIGAQIDKLGASSVKTGRALNNASEELDELVRSLGALGTTLDTDLAVLRNLGLEGVAGAAGVQAFESSVGSDRAEAFREVGKASKNFENGIAKLGTAINGLVAGPWAALLNAIGNAAAALSGIRSRGDIESELAAKRERLVNITNQGSVAGRAGASRGRQIATLSQDIQKLEAELEKIEASSKGVLDTNKLITDEINRQVAAAKQATSAVEGELTNRRDVQASVRGQVAVLKATNELTKIQLNLEGDITDEKRKQLELDEKLAKEAVKQAEAAKRNAEEQARRQIERDKLAAKVRDSQAVASAIRMEAEVEKIRDGTLASQERAVTLYKISRDIQRKILIDQQKLEAKYVLEADLKQKLLKAQERELQLFDKTTNLQVQRQEAANFERNDRQKAVEQARELLTLEAEINAERAKRATDPNYMLSFSGAGLGFFSKSAKLEADQIADRTAQLEKYNEQLANLKQRLAEANKPGSGASGDLKFNLGQDIKELEIIRNNFERLQPEIDAAALAQARFNDAFNAVSPAVNSLVNGLKEVVAGTKTAEEAFADFLNTIADQLVQTAATMIAQYIAIGIARSFAGIPGPKTPTNPGGGTALGGTLGGGATRVTAIPVIPFAEGGYVTRPTRAVIGEGGEPEYVIPASKMSESMARYSGGSRGNEVVPNNATGGGNGPTSSAGAPLFDLQTTVINNVEYATVEDVRAMGARATSAGAKQGEARVMSSLKNSRSMRSRVGI